MIQLVISGACGHMGKVVAKLAEENPTFKIVAGVDRFAENYGEFPVFSSFDEIVSPCDAVIDFSKPALLPDLLAYCENGKIPLVLCTTGYSESDLKFIEKAAQKIPLFFSANMSLGVNLLQHLAQEAAKILGKDFDIEIIEKHHNRKVDAPSGTALMLADSINDVLPETYAYEYDYHTHEGARDPHSIGIHSVRGGTIVGEHDVIFAGHDEVLTLSHEALSRDVFAAGALKAAEFLPGKPAGKYDMGSLMK